MVKSDHLLAQIKKIAMLYQAAYLFIVVKQ